MDGFGLVLGHLLGDYIFQNDWMAANKTSRSFPCAVHCTAYTLAVWLCSFWWLPIWALAVIWLAHFPLDRWRLAKLWMERVSGQTKFASAPGLAPWSVIVVDNTMHLTVLFLLGVFVQG